MKNIAFLGIAIVIIAAVALVGLNQTGFFDLPANSAGQGTVKIGVHAALTGDAALYGESSVTALGLAQDEINSKGGILGKKVELVFEDSQCNANEGVKAMNSLVNLKGIRLVLSNDCSGPTLAAAPIAEKAKALYLVATASNPDIKYAGEYVFRIMPSDDGQGKDLAGIIYGKGYRNAAVLFGDNAYGEGITKVFVKEFERLGGKIVVQQSFNQNDNDFRTQLLKIKGASPDALFIAGYPQAYELIIKQIYEMDLKIQIFASDTFKETSIISALGGKAEGIIFTGLAESDNEKFLHFKEAYKKKYGKEHEAYSDYFYDSLYVLKAGIEQAHSFDPEVLKNTLYELDYNGVTGRTKFDSYGEVDKPYGIWVVRNGEFVPYK